MFYFRPYFNVSFPVKRVRNRVFVHLTIWLFVQVSLWPLYPTTYQRKLFDLTCKKIELQQFAETTSKTCQICAYFSWWTTSWLQLKQELLTTWQIWNECNFCVGFLNDCFNFQTLESEFFAFSSRETFSFQQKTPSPVSSGDLIKVLFGKIQLLHPDAFANNAHKTLT